MKTLVIFYSYTGKTRKLAQETARKEKADIVEVTEQHPRSKLNAYVLGSFAARGQKETQLHPYVCNMDAYDRIIIAMPIWAGFPAPPMNNIIHSLPGGKQVELFMTSGSGHSGSSAEKTKKRIADRGCTVVKYLDMKC